MIVTINFKHSDLQIEFNYLTAIEEDNNFGTPEVIEILNVKHNGGDITELMECFDSELKDKISQYLNN